MVILEAPVSTTRDASNRGSQSKFHRQVNLSPSLPLSSLLARGDYDGTSASVTAHPPPPGRCQHFLPPAVRRLPLMFDLRFLAALLLIRDLLSVLAELASSYPATRTRGRFARAAQVLSVPRRGTLQAPLRTLCEEHLRVILSSTRVSCV
jgi:hypothetical protein